ncbi:hypothetical protein BKA80DRAFT_141422 [Phyllosticta citrichinensis]
MAAWTSSCMQLPVLAPDSSNTGPSIFSTAHVGLGVNHRVCNISLASHCTILSLASSVADDMLATLSLSFPSCGVALRISTPLCGFLSASASAFSSLCCPSDLDRSIQPLDVAVFRSVARYGAGLMQQPARREDHESVGFSLMVSAISPAHVCLLKIVAGLA